MSHSSNSQISQAEQSANAILALINSQPRTPTKDELAAIIAKTALPPPCAGAPKLRAEWDAAMVACKAVEPVATDEEMGQPMSASMCARSTL
jgi:hypothetical protein